MQAQSKVSIVKYLLISLLPFGAIYTSYKVGRLRWFILISIIASTVGSAAIGAVAGGITDTDMMRRDGMDMGRIDMIMDGIRNEMRAEGMSAETTALVNEKMQEIRNIAAGGMSKQTMTEMGTLTNDIKDILRAEGMSAEAIARITEMMGGADMMDTDGMMGGADPNMMDDDMMMMDITKGDYAEDDSPVGYFLGAAIHFGMLYPLNRWFNSWNAKFETAN